MHDPRPTILEVSKLNAYYGHSQALHKVELFATEGETISILGRNGAGKTTMLRAIMGLVRRTGSIRHKEADITGLEPHQIARRGIGYVPEERGIFGSLDVTENLMLPPTISDDGMSVEAIYALFPSLKLRARSPGSKLSGGEQQMLAVARVLRTGARLLFLDEVTEGLAPVVVEQLEGAIGALKRSGYTILLVEQNLAFATRLADRHYVLENGAIVDALDAESLSGGALDRVKTYMGV